MKNRILERETILPAPLEEVFNYFADAANLGEATPPWLNFRILSEPPIEMRPGALIDYRLRVRGIPIRWRTEILEWEPPHRFTDRQLRGPYKLWHHEHTFESCGGGTRMVDRVTYLCPGWIFEPLIHALFVESDLRRIFDYRTQVFERVFQGDGAESTVSA